MLPFGVDVGDLAIVSCINFQRGYYNIPCASYGSGRIILKETPFFGTTDDMDYVS